MHLLENERAARSVGSASSREKNVSDGGDQEQKDPGKGFAGLSSMVSDVDGTLVPPARKPQARTQPDPTGTAPATPDSSERPYQAPPQPTGGSGAGKWLLGIGAVVGVLWLAAQSGDKTSAPAPAYTPSEPPPSAAVPSPTWQPPAVTPLPPTRPVEDRPPVGTGIVLSNSQIRYCLAEDIRMTAAKSVISGYNEADVDRFNGMVADYNSRCSSFKYRRGSLESVRAEVENTRAELEAEGRGRFRQDSPKSQRKVGALDLASRSGAVKDPPDLGVARDGRPPQRESSERLNDGEMSESERQSLEAACSTDKYVNGPSAYNNCIARQLSSLRRQASRPSLDKLSRSERESIEATCSTDKYVNGPAAYNSCLTQQLAALSRTAGRPDLSRLSSAELTSIEAACSTDKYVNGPAAYNKCLSLQLQQLSRQGAGPSLGGLLAGERASIESACSTDKYVNGPAAYNACLARQLVLLGK